MFNFDFWAKLKFYQIEFSSIANQFLAISEKVETMGSEFWALSIQSFRHAMNSIQSSSSLCCFENKRPITKSLIDFP